MKTLGKLSTRIQLLENAESVADIPKLLPQTLKDLVHVLMVRVSHVLKLWF